MPSRMVVGFDGDEEPDVSKQRQPPPQLLQKKLNQKMVYRSGPQNTEND